MFNWQLFNWAMLFIKLRIQGFEDGFNVENTIIPFRVRVKIIVFSVFCFSLTLEGWENIGNPTFNHNIYFRF